jgi:ELWxxDGT repeat protein
MSNPRPVADIRPGAASSVPRYLTALGKTLVFTADDGASGVELWRSDGTAAGTTRIADIRPGLKGDATTLPASSSPNGLTAVGRTLFFSADDGHGQELWSSDGTTAGTRRIADINRVPTGTMRSGSSFPADFVASGRGILFSADDGIHGRELWRTDGTTAGTRLLADIRSGGKRSGSSPRSLTALGRRTVFFSAFDDSSGRELWRTDGTTAGTTRITDLNSGSSSSNPGDLTVVDSTLFFSADDGRSGRELWRSDGTTAGTSRVTDLRPGRKGSNPSNLTALGDRLFFFANDGITGNQLWRSDGTAAGTVPVAKVPVPRSVTVVGDALIFNTNRRLWRSDGTADGTAPIGRLHPGGEGKLLPPNWLTAIGPKLYFDGTQQGSGRELWTLVLAGPQRADPGSGGVAGLA